MELCHTMFKHMCVCQMVESDGAAVALWNAACSAGLGGGLRREAGDIRLCPGEVSADGLLQAYTRVSMRCARE